MGMILQLKAEKHPWHKNLHTPLKHQKLVYFYLGSFKILTYEWLSINISVKFNWLLPVCLIGENESSFEG